MKAKVKLSIAERDSNKKICEDIDTELDIPFSMFKGRGGVSFIEIAPGFTISVGYLVEVENA